MTAGSVSPRLTESVQTLDHGADHITSGPVSSATNQRPHTASAPVLISGTQPAGESNSTPHLTSHNGSSSRTVVVLLSGFDSQGRKHSSSHTLREHLLAQGVQPENIVMLPSQYPRFMDQCEPEEPVDFSQGFFRGAFRWFRQKVSNWCMQAFNLYQNVRLYWQYSDPDSIESQLAYRQLRSALNLRPGEQVTLNFIGFSGGGQQATTLAHLAQQDPAIQDVNRVFTVGSPMMTNYTRPETEVISYVSLNDWVLLGTSGLPLVRFVPPSRDENDQVRYCTAEHTRYFELPQVLEQLTTDLLQGQPALTQPPPSSGNLPMPKQNQGTPEPPESPLQEPPLSNLGLLSTPLFRHEPQVA